MGGVLGLDLATNWGWAYVDDEGCLQESGRKTLPVGVDIGHKLHDLMLAVSDLCDEYSPDFIAVEKPIHAGRCTSFETAMLLYSLVGVAGVVAHIREIGFFQMPRSTACKQAIGQGRISKENGVDWAFQQRGRPVTEDEADAIIVALAGHKLREREVC